MKALIYNRFRSHVFTVRFGLTTTFLQYLFWLRMTVRLAPLVKLAALMVLSLGDTNSNGRS
jgi:hypothetical protein